MEHLRKSFEFEDQKQTIFEIPTNELISDIKKSKDIWTDECNNPQFVEQVELRKNDSKVLDGIFNNLANPTTTIEQALESGDISSKQAINLYDSLSNILENNDYQRLILYLPFEILPDKSIYHHEGLEESINKFRNAYLAAWYDLLNVNDIRANFVDGDVLEVEARPEDPPRVVKAAHLSPWLVSLGMIKVDELLDLMSSGDTVLQRSIADTLPILDNMRLLDNDEKEALFRIKASIPAERTKEPLFISEARQKWLFSKDLENNIRPHKKTPAPDLSPLSGPFSENMKQLELEAKDIGDKLISKEKIDGMYNVALLGGSRLKGYSDEKSDIDICIFVKSDISECNKIKLNERFKSYNLSTIKLDTDEKLVDSKERWVHDLFNTSWIGDRKSIINLQRKLIPEYFYEKDPSIRARCTERLEQDLLQYRLMHKGYARHYPAYNERLTGDKEIDGQSAFYDSGYRQIATKLFINKVFIPKI